MEAAVISEKDQHSTSPSKRNAHIVVFPLAKLFSTCGSILAVTYGPREVGSSAVVVIERGAKASTGGNVGITRKKSSFTKPK